LTTTEWEATPQTFEAHAHDEPNGLAITVELALHDGVLAVRAELTNTAPDDYHLAALRLSLPLPARARDVATFEGRWANEFLVERHDVGVGTVTTANRRGRTSHDHPPTVLVGLPGWSNESGTVWMVHHAWSANSELSVDAPVDARRSVQVGELLHPGEVTLASGERYWTPWVYGAFSEAGANGVSQAFHRFVRGRTNHPRSVRPVILNTWEAVYFDHDLDTLRRLAECGADVGAERFVLDDGWFHGRRNDRAGLGDWWVDSGVWPQGLGPLVEHVRSLGMEFGIWVEPEMVNPDSDLYRAHPDWVLADPAHAPILGRHQLVLDLARPEASEEIFTRLDALLGEYPISYVKWDMNRDHVAASHRGRAGTHEQTVAMYRLFDRIRTAHPTVEFESCASGGGRVDLGILEHCQRIWTSDCNDALDRQSIQRGFSYLLPLELMGAHVGPPQAHTTNRRHSLDFRAATAIFGSFGIEWNLLEATTQDLAHLRLWIERYKAHRELFHRGDLHRIDHETLTAFAVVDADRRHAVVSAAAVHTAPSLLHDRLRVPGLEPLMRYHVSVLHAPDPLGPARRQPEWIRSGVDLSGRELARLGLQLPVLHPESALLLSLVGNDAH
jgi:alpha-galactosidase